MIIIRKKATYFNDSNNFNFVNMAYATTSINESYFAPQE